MIVDIKSKKNIVKRSRRHDVLLIFHVAVHTSTMALPTLFLKSLKRDFYPNDFSSILKHGNIDYSGQSLLDILSLF